MKFEDALKAMREGKKVRCLSLSPNTFELEPWTKRFFVNDGFMVLKMNIFWLMIGRLWNEYI